MNRTPARMALQTEAAYHFVKDHTNEAFRVMNEMRQSQSLCDIQLNVGELVIYAHKVVLASTSQYFHAMFTNEMIEKHSSEINMRDIDSQALQQLIDYAYTSQIAIGEHNVQVLLPAACLLQMNRVREACCKFLMRQLHPANCLGIQRFADTHACDDLRRLSHQYALYNFMDVCDTEEFLSLPFEDLNEIIQSDDLNVENEEQVYKACINWVNHDIDFRRHHVAELLSNIRLPLLSRDFLMTTVESDPIMNYHPDCKDLLIEAMKYHLLPERRPLMDSKRTKSRRGRRSRPVIFTVGGGSLFAVHSECEYYDSGSDQWISTTSMQTRRTRSGVGVTHSKLYVVGGFDGAQYLASAECFNPKSNKWTWISSMGTKRSCHGSCGMNGLIYVMGGFDGASCLNSAERYDPLTDTWCSLPAMNIRRRYLKLAVLDGVIYAVGGYDGAVHLTSVEKYDPQLNRWTTSPGMINRRSSAGVAVMDGFIYVSGGADGATTLSSMERFNPRRNLWEAMPSMMSRRSTHDLMVLNGCLYAVGGNDGSTSLNSVEMFNPRASRWSLVTSMNLRRSSHGTALLDLPKPRHQWTSCHNLSS